MHQTGKSLDFSGGGTRAATRVAVFTESEAPRLLDFLAARPDVDLRTNLAPENFKTLIRDDSLDFALIVGEGFQTKLDERTAGDIQIYLPADKERTDKRMESILEAFEKQVVRARLDSLAMDSELLRVVETKKTAVATDRGGISRLTGTIIALLLLLVVLLAALVPKPGISERMILVVVASLSALIGLLLSYHFFAGSELVRTSVAPLLKGLLLLFTFLGMLSVGFLFAALARFLEACNPWLRFFLNLIFWLSFVAILAWFVFGNGNDGVVLLGFLNAVRSIFTTAEPNWLLAISLPILAGGLLGGKYLFQK